MADANYGVRASGVHQEAGINLEPSKLDQLQVIRHANA